jgi:NADH:ubiquinone reductase (H+-translocating)
VVTRPRVVIIGGGFAGVEAAKALRRAPLDVVLIDRTNHHVFQPLLYQVATGSLAPTDIAVPIRWMLRKQKNTRVILGEVSAIDVAGRSVEVDGGAMREPFDFLIVAGGARHAYFGHGEWEADAPGLKSIADAMEIRDRFLVAFERAEMAESDAERAAWQTMVIVGGGPTGVELAGIMASIAKTALVEDFRRIDTTATRVVLVEGGGRLLPALSEHLSERAKRDLEKMGVEVRLDTLVTEVNSSGVRIGTEQLAARTVFWAAGNQASELSASLSAPLDRQRRVHVEPDLSLPGMPNVFVVGDQAAVVSAGRPVPAVAPAAMQMGRAAAKNILHTIRRQPRRPFHYFNKGDLATIGRYSAVAAFGKLEVTGALAWFLWLFVHIMYLAGFRNRISVLLQWGYAYFTYQRGARLIRDGVRGD